MKRVALYQNTIGGGGRIVVLAAMTKVLNDYGIIPDWIAFRHNYSDMYANTVIGQHIEYKKIKMKKWSRFLGEYKYIKMNRLMNTLGRSYDLVINSNNTIAELVNDKNFVHYIHFPRLGWLSEGYSNATVSITFLAKIYIHLYRSKIHGKQHGQLIANSEFTRNSIVELYDKSREEIIIIYPPVPQSNEDLNIKVKDPKRVVSVGRFSSQKNQLWQIQIAKHCPELNFYIIGHVGHRKSRKYYNRVKRELENSNIDNVTLLPNIAKSDLNHLLKNSSYFLHTMVEEPFGIATIEAMRYGCIPIAHDSGGQHEIIRDKRLLFTSQSEAVNKLTAINNISINVLNQLRKDLRAKTRLYNLNTFSDKFTKLLNYYAIVS